MMAVLSGKFTRRIMMGVHTKEKLDEDWIELIKEAKKLGLTVEEVHAFLQEESK